MNRTLLYLSLAIGAALNVAGDVAIKKWSRGEAPLALGLMLYILDALAWAAVMKQGADMGRSAVIWEIAVVMMVITAGVVIFGEKLSVMTRVGICLALAGVVLVEMGQG